MPSQYSSQHSRDDAADLAKRTGLDYRVVPIQPMVDTFLANVSLSGLAVENLQARVRGVVLMALSNQEGHLVLTTGNKSELAVGYSTLYGDSVGGFNPLKDVPKLLVWQLARWRDEEAVRRGEVAPIPENSIVKPPSAELRPGQLDTDSLPAYEVLDPLLFDYIDRDMGRDELIAAGHDPALVDRVLRMVDLAEYKRRQAAPGTKISIKAFGRDRRLPITNRFRETARPEPATVPAVMSSTAP
jgi:NAD+ synthase (glutamine-hydrolysing)